jgi:hypothetical protein
MGPKGTRLGASGFYYAMGFKPLEVFPELWAPHNPCLQLVKFIGRR